MYRFGRRLALQATAPNKAPTPEDTPMAKALQKTTRMTPGPIFAPPADGIDNLCGIGLQRIHASAIGNDKADLRLCAKKSRKSA
jgi:hypothetical protein